MPKAPRDDDVKRQVGLRLRCVREVLGLDQRTFARAIGAGTNALGNWERGERLADSLAMMRLFDRFAFPMEWVFGGRLAWMDFDVQERLREEAAKLGAVIGGTVAEWPAAVERRPGTAGQREPAKVPRRRKPSGGYLHQPKGSEDFQ